MTLEAGYMLTQIVELKHHLDIMGWFDWKAVLVIGAVLFILAYLDYFVAGHSDIVLSWALIIAVMLLTGLFALDVHCKEEEYETLCAIYRAVYGPLPWDVVA